MAATVEKVDLKSHQLIIINVIIVYGLFMYKNLIIDHLSVENVMTFQQPFLLLSKILSHKNISIDY